MHPARSKALPLVMFLSICGLLPVAIPSCSPYASQTLETESTEWPAERETETPRITEQKVEKPQPTPFLTHSALPSRSSNELSKSIIELYESNGGCRFPCWWGMTPGEIVSAEELSRIKALSLDYTVYEDKEDYIHHEFYFDISNSSALYDSLPLDLTIEGGANVIREIFAGHPDFPLARLLEQYGTPEQIWFNAIGTPQENETRDFDLTFFYPNYGFMMDYSGVSSKPDQSGTIAVCIEDILTDSTVAYWAWRAESNSTFEEIADPNLLGLPPFQRTFREISEFSNLHTSAFSQNGGFVEGRICLETSIYSWP